jgi:uncharacterized protein (DUF1330 family)
MKGYVIANIQVHDPEGYAEYRRLSPQVLKEFGARYLVLGGENRVPEGDWTPQRLVVIEFESYGKAQEWYDSERYRPAMDVRKKTATTQLILIQGAA